MSLTVVTTLKPGDNVPFLNALGSWKALGFEVLVAGKYPWFNETYRAFPVSETGPHDLVYLDEVLTRARMMATHDELVLTSDHLIFLGGLTEAVELVSGHFSDFLITGHRWELKVQSVVDYSVDWQVALSMRLRQASLGSSVAKDYFIFPKTLDLCIPPFLLGREWWDTWLIWAAHEAGIPMIDATKIVQVVHQTHGWPSPGGRRDRAADPAGVYNDQLFQSLVEELRPGVGSILNVSHEVIEDGQGNWILSDREEREAD